MRTLCATTLLSEFIIIGLAALVATRLSDASTGAVWAVSGTAMVLCLLLSGLVGRPGTVPFGWALQIGLIASGFVVPVMFLIGAAFAALWGASVHFGGQVDAFRAAHAAQTADADPADSVDSAP
ncbi:DUF4233 domain-containing protein [Streptomyces sp. 6N223]|uniref:DUF4233 domain-containing protein n=1 Tax=Streptomyces sp. 6N223 TaxID=3457412 RepID=UPI003FD152A4